MLLERLHEAQAVVARRPRLFVLHVCCMCSTGFLVLFQLFLYSRLACTSELPSNQIFWLYLVFNSMLFIGSCLAPQLIKWIEPCRLLFICCAVSAMTLWLLSTVWSAYLIAITFCLSGASLGIYHSVTTFSFLKCFSNTNDCLVHTLYFFQALGALLATLLYESFSGNEHSLCEDIHSVTHHVLLGDSKFHLKSGIRLDAVCFLYGVTQVIIMYLLLTTPMEPSEEDIARQQYEDIEPQTQTTVDVPSVKLILLSSTIACTATVLQTTFPFLIFSHPDGRISFFQIFSIFYLWGRLVALFTSDKMAPYVYVGLCIIGCGAACCAFIFDEGLLIGSILFGFFLSPFVPALITYIRFTLKLKVEATFLLLSGSTFGYLLFPLFLSITSPSESRVFVAFFFFSTLLLVLLFVSMLNVQAQLDTTKSTNDKVRQFIDRFFSGENLLKRTRSIRPFISRLRQNSYKRFSRRNLRQKTPTIEITLETDPPIDCN